MNICKLCGKETKHKSLICRSCIAKRIRAEQKADPEKAKRYHDKVSANMKLAHKDGKRKESYIKSGETIKKNISKLTKNELKKKYSPYQHMSEEEINNHYNKIMNTGCHKWWKNAPEQQRKGIINKRAETLRNTWEVNGSKILNKMQKTSLKNNGKRIYIKKEKWNKIFNSLDKTLDELMGE